MKCPKCDDAALVPRKVKGAGTELDRCPSCKGLWFDDGELPEVLGAPGPSPRVPPQAKRRDLACPRCGEPLYTCCYPGTVVLVERCRACAGTWLDDREVNRVHAARASADAAAARQAQAAQEYELPGADGGREPAGGAAARAPSGRRPPPLPSRPARACMAPASAAVRPMMRCPKCAATVPKDSECAQCGVIVERYLAAEARRRDRERRLAEEFPYGQGLKGRLLRFVNGTIERFTGWDVNGS